MMLASTCSTGALRVEGIARRLCCSNGSSKRRRPTRAGWIGRDESRNNRGGYGRNSCGGELLGSSSNRHRGVEWIAAEKWPSDEVDISR